MIPKASKALLLTFIASLSLTAAPTFADSRPQTDAEKKAIDYFLKTQDPTGAWLPQIGPAVTALITKALLQAGKPIDDPAVAKALAFIDKFHHPDGGYYSQGQMNYSTCCVLSAFASLPDSAKPDYKDKITKAQLFLKSMQRIEGTTDGDGKIITKDNPWYGGSGYGEDRPDLSNTSFFVDALRDTGVPADDPAIQKASVFVTRCQLNQATNAEPWAKGQDEGGFIYTTDKGGDSKFGDEDKLDGSSVLRSYGSMTYAGLKSFIYAGLTKDDPRVQAAIKWIENNWSLDTNPGTSSAMGLFYYYHTFAKAMQLLGQDTVTDAKGVKHDWREELANALIQRQNPDGSWINTKSARWYESQPLLVTAYSTLALQEIRK